MNEQIMQSIEDEMASEVAITQVEIKPTIKEMLKQIDEADLDHQVHQTIDLVVTDFTSRAEALRHRADMMRRRADEFDEMADLGDKLRDKVIKELNAVNDMDKQIQELLAQHAHINPRRA